LRIAAIHNFLYTKSGAQLAFLNMMLSLKKRGHEIDIYVLDISEKLRRELRDHFFIVSMNVKDHKLLRKLLPFVDMVRIYRKYRRVAKKINNGNYDVTFINHYIYSPLILPCIKIPKVYYLYEPPRIYYEPPFSKKDEVIKIITFYNKYLDKFCVKYADLILSSSDYSGKYAKKVYGKTSITNYLGVDLDKYKKIKNVKKENLTISVGVLQPHKGHEFSIRSIGLIPKEKRPKLIIIAALGSKNEKKKLYKLAKKLDVNLEIKGYVPDEEFVKLHNKAKLVVIPFIREPSIEPVALACETPIVAVREGGARETIIHNKTGILTNRDEKEFAKAIEYLLDNPEIAENMGKKGREWIKNNFTWEICGENLEKNLNKIIKVYSTEKLGLLPE